MYAILKLGGHQYRVSAGDRLLIDRIPAEVGSTVTLEHVLLVGDDASTQSGAEQLAKARVTATVVAHRRGRKLRVFSYKAKKRHRRTLGYRSQLTELQVDEVLSDGAGKRGAARSDRAAKPASKDDTAETKAAAPKDEAAETKTSASKDDTAEATATKRGTRRGAAAKDDDVDASSEQPARKPARRTQKKADDGA